jgi:hypothetical protein
VTRRDNGLPGGDWQQLADLAPPIADHLLDELRSEGIAAYAAPSTGTTGPYLNAESHPRPLDRVFVGEAQIARAREVAARLLPELDSGWTEDEPPAPAAVEDDVWAGIVASFAAPPADQLARWSGPGEPADTSPGADVDTENESPTAGGPSTGTATGFEDIQAELADARPAPAAGAADDPHDHYVPPPPPPLPSLDNVSRAAWSGLIGGPLFLVLATLLGWGPGGFVGLLAVLAFVGGFVTLVTRMRDDPPNGPDDGAVV